VTRCSGVYRRTHHLIADFDTLRYSACLITPWTEWSAKAECIEGHITITAGFDIQRYSACSITRGLSGPQRRSVSKATLPQPQASIHCVTQPAFTSPWTEWSAVAECIEGHISFNAVFDTYATAYYSACFTSPWTECFAMVECTEGHITLSQTSIHCVTQPAQLPVD
jgi:hypothetical protein